MTLIDTVKALINPIAVQTLQSVDAAIQAAAPGASLDKWREPLRAAFMRFDLTTPKRISAALGQFTVEAGVGFTEVVENTRYTTPSRLVAIFPHEFDLDTANRYAGNAIAIANRAYACKLGNGDEASGDGNRFKGRGLIQLTGRDEYKAFADAMQMSTEEAASYCETAEGAAMSGCWYLSWRNLTGAMDEWRLSDVTRGVNGSAMLGNNERIAAANRALAAFDE